VRTNEEDTAGFVVTILAVGRSALITATESRARRTGRRRPTRRRAEVRPRPPAGAAASDGGQPAANPAGESPQPAAQSFGDQKWWEVFQDPQLQQLVRTALQQNYDVRIAATRILQAQALLGITRADQLPTVTAGASATNDRFPRQKLAPD
jgi:outer membrane protein TolC